MEYTVNQAHLRACQNRINGLTVEVALGKPYQSELERMQAARLDILSRMTEKEIADQAAYETRVLTPAERAAEAKKLAAQMAENRDKPSI